MFWQEFKGRWLPGNEFYYPEKTPNLPKMKPVKNWNPKQDAQR